MSTKAYVKDSSAYSPSLPYVRDSGSWKPVAQIFGKAGGVWSSVFASPGSIDRRFLANLGFNSTVYSIDQQPDGKILVGGQFTSLNGTTANRLVRLNSDETVDTAFTTNMGTGFDNNIVYSIALQSDGKILVGGYFTTFNGTTANRLARLNSDGTLDTAFMANIGTGPSSTVQNIALQSDGKILVGGSFGTFNGTTVTRIARLNSDGTLDTTFTTNIGTSFNSNVNSIVLQSDGKILVGGYFTTFNGTTTNRLARLNSDGTLDTTFTTNMGTGLNSAAWNIALQSDDKILVVGQFTTFNGTTANRIARLNSDGTLDTAFMANIGTGLSSTVYSIDLQPDGKILVGGGFPSFNGTAASRIARLNSDGTLDTAFMANIGTGFSNTVRSIALQSDGKILVGGQFTSLNGGVSNTLVRLNSDGTVDSYFTPGPYTTPFRAPAGIRSVALQTDGKIVAAGSCFAAASATETKIVRLNSDGTLDTTFMANIGTGFNGTVYSIALQPDDKILVGGSSSSFNGTTTNAIARLNSDGTLDTTFTTNIGTGFSSTVQNIALQSDGKILVGGEFTSFNGTSAARIARLNSDGTLDTAFTTNLGASGFDNRVYTFSLQSDGKILVGGWFTIFTNGTTANRIARLNSDGTRDTAFMANIGTGFNFYVWNIALQSDGKILVGGGFSSLNGIAANSLVRLNSDGTLDTAFTENMGTGFSSVSRIYTISLQSDGKIVVAGEYLDFNGKPAGRFVRVNSDGTPDFLFSVPAAPEGTQIYCAKEVDGGKYLMVGSDGDFGLGPNYNGLVYFNL